MVRKIIWSKRAKSDRIEILNYWLRRNKSKVYPKKLNELFNKSIQWIAVSANPDKETDIAHVFVKLVRDYKVFYENKNDEIHIITIIDTRRNPDIFLNLK